MKQVIMEAEMAKEMRELKQDHMDSVLYILEEAMDNVLESESAKKVKKEEEAVFQIILEMLQKWGKQVDVFNSYTCLQNPVDYCLTVNL